MRKIKQKIANRFCEDTPSYVMMLPWCHLVSIDQEPLDKHTTPFVIVLQGMNTVVERVDLIVTWVEVWVFADCLRLLAKKHESSSGQSHFTSQCLLSLQLSSHCLGVVDKGSMRGKYGSTYITWRKEKKYEKDREQTKYENEREREREKKNIWKVEKKEKYEKERQKKEYEKGRRK